MVDRTRAGERIRYDGTTSTSGRAPLEPGAVGVVLCVDWQGSVHVAWPCGIAYALNAKDQFTTMPEESLPGEDQADERVPPSPVRAARCRVW